MALSGSVITNKYDNIMGLKCTWTGVQSMADNQTIVSWRLESDGSQYYSYYVGSLSLVIDGITVLSINDRFLMEGGGKWYQEGTTTITHNTDGSRSFSISIAAGIYNWGSVNCRGSSTFTLDTIPRASTIGATDSNIGSVSMIVVSRKSAAYTHSVMFRFGTVIGYITEDGGISANEVTLSAVSIPFKVPDSFYGQIPDAPSGVCTLTCRTYSGNTQIGEAQPATFIATAAEALCKPVVSGTVVDSNAATKALTGDSSKLVRFMSTALCTISAEARNGASISRKTIGGAVISGDTRSIPEVETGNILFEAVDSRGYATRIPVTASLVPYIKLTNNAVVNRTDPTSGNAVLSLRGACFCGSFGTADNAVTAKYSINGGAEISVTPVMADGAYSLDIALSGLDYTRQHTIEVTVSDKLDSQPKTLTLKRGIPVFDWGENDFAFNVPVYFNQGFVNKGTGS